MGDALTVYQMLHAIAVARLAGLTDIRPAGSRPWRH
jgi:hypothetical protein